MSGSGTKLHYFHGPGPLRSLIMTRERRRVELYIKQIDDQTFALVALAGEPTSQPDRTKCQGPYLKAPQAEAALRGIAGTLLDKDYSMTRQPPVWSVQAQRLARQIRADHSENSGNFSFDPEQHEPIW